MIGAQWAGEVPAGAHLLELELIGDPLDAAEFITATATLTGPDDAVLGVYPATITEGIPELELEWPADAAPLPTTGIYTLDVRLYPPDNGRSIRCDPIEFVAQGRDGWHNIRTLRAAWPDAPAADARLWELLEHAKEAVLAYAERDPEARPPLRYRTAQAMQARNLWNSAKVDAGGGYGEDSFVIRPYPLDWMIKQVIRPKRGTPVIG